MPVFVSIGWTVIPTARQSDVSTLVSFNLREALPSSSGSLLVYEAVNLYHTKHRHLLPTLPGWTVPDLLSSLPGFEVQETDLGPRLIWSDLTQAETAPRSRFGMWHHANGFSDSTPWDCSLAGEDDPELCAFEIASTSVASSVFVPIRPRPDELVWSPSSPRYIADPASPSDDRSPLELSPSTTEAAPARQTTPVSSRYSSSPPSPRGTASPDGFSSSRRSSHLARPRVYHRVWHSTPLTPPETSSSGSILADSAPDVPDLWPLPTLAEACRAAALALLVVSQHCNTS